MTIQLVRWPVADSGLLWCRFVVQSQPNPVAQKTSFEMRLGTYWLMDVWKQETVHRRLTFLALGVALLSSVSFATNFRTPSGNGCEPARTLQPAKIGQADHMKKSLMALIILCLALSLVTTNAATTTNPAPANPASPGQQMAQTLSLITGVAISPLMGVGVVGAVEWWKAKTPEQKNNLHWFAHPLFWIPALLLVAACFVKDSSGIVLPPLLKKPFDVAETIEHKISGLVATGAFVPIAASIFHASGTGTGASLGSLGFAAIDLSGLYNALMVPIAMIAFFIVFLASNAINILILLSPFGAVDAALKAFRTSIIASVAATSFANPWIGAAWALIIIGLSWLIAGWSFRLSHFGLAFIWDFVTCRYHRFQPDPMANKVFLGRKIDYGPARTYGKLSLNEKGRLALKYRPWLVLPERNLVLPEAKYAAGKGLFFSEILQLDGEKSKIALLLPPRYRSHEPELVAIYGLTDVRDTGLLAGWQWFKSMLGFKSRIPAT
jgi:MFS family permease